MDLHQDLKLDQVSSAAGGGRGGDLSPTEILSEKFALSGITEMVISYFTSFVL